MSADLLRTLDLRHMADREEDRRLGQAVHRHVQQAREVGDGPPMPKAKVMMPMCSIDE